ncbi:hypothetical protein A4G20_08005 [Pasteurellaceae bacterium RH1A]|nr:hypothetical protein A4G20_08005 [Pasteurellaceae bacterium RH1A]
MFKINAYSEIMQAIPSIRKFVHHNAEISLEDDIYQAYLRERVEVEFTPDILIFDYENALKENAYLHKHYPNIAEKVWIMGRSGQGDEWFIHKGSKQVLFYDHGLGEYQHINDFQDMKIRFDEFVVLADLYKQLDLYLDKHEISDSNKGKFIELVNSIESGLFDRYPYEVFFRSA